MRRIIRPWIIALLALVAIDLAVRGPFFDHFIARRYVGVGRLTRDRTNGIAWQVVFEGVARQPRPDLRVGLVGDSTVYATENLSDRASPAWFLLASLQRRLPGLEIQVVDVSHLGFFANDAVLMINKLLTSEVDVIVYGLTLRAMPAAPNVRWSSHLARELTACELVRITDAGGGPWLWASLSSAELLGSLVQDMWATYAYRGFLKSTAWEHIMAPVMWPSIAAAIEPRPYPPPPTFAPRTHLGDETDWTYARYGIPNSNWTALEIIGHLCEKHTPGRCLLYSGPINPLDRDRLAEGTLREEYGAELRTIVGRHGLPFRDFSDTLAADEFRKPMFLSPGDRPLRDPIHMNVKGARKLAVYLADAIIDIADSTLARRAARSTPSPQRR